MAALPAVVAGVGLFTSALKLASDFMPSELECQVGLEKIYEEDKMVVRYTLVFDRRVAVVGRSHAAVEIRIEKANRQKPATQESNGAKTASIELPDANLRSEADERAIIDRYVDPKLEVFTSLIAGIQFALQDTFTPKEISLRDAIETLSERLKRFEHAPDIAAVRVYDYIEYLYGAERTREHADHKSHPNRRMFVFTITETARPRTTTRSRL